MNKRSNISIYSYIKFLLIELTKTYIPFSYMEDYKINIYKMVKLWDSINHETTCLYSDVVYDFMDFIIELTKFHNNYLYDQEKLNNPIVYDYILFDDIIYLLNFLKRICERHDYYSDIYQEDIYILFIKYNNNIFIKYKEKYINNANKK